MLYAVITGFGSQGTEDIFRRRNTTVARRTCPPNLWSVARRKLDSMDGVTGLNELSEPRGNRLEPLYGRRAGWHSIRINEQWRIVFLWGDAGPEEVEIVDYHNQRR